MSRPLGVAIGATHSLPGQIEHNLAQIETFARRAAADGMDLLLTPELSASGYGGYPEVLALAERAGDGPIFSRLQTLAQETGVVLCAGFAEKVGDIIYLSHYAVFPDGNFVVQRKHRVTKSEAPLQPAFPQLAPFGGDGTGVPEQEKFHVFEVNGVRCALVICADAGIADLNQTLDQLQVDLILLPTGAGGQRSERVTTAELATPEGRATYLQWYERVFWPGNAARDCLLNRRSMAAVNMVGHDGQKFYHLGHGSIVNALGEIVGFFPGIVNLDRQKPCYSAAMLDADEHIPREVQL